MPGYAEAPTCGCGDQPGAHIFVPDVRIWWCGVCGSWRRPFENTWHVPLEQARTVAQHARYVMVDAPAPASSQEEVPTRPDVRTATLRGVAAAAAGDEGED
jgi:hypothetical protein